MNIARLIFACSCLLYEVSLFGNSSQPYYMRTIELVNHQWKQKIKLLSSHQILTVTELITTTYELLHENINLLITKIALEEKLAHIQTMSLTEEWHNIFNIQESDIKPLYQRFRCLTKITKKNTRYSSKI